jgi:ABC-type spermidine/putrescine transport system permease subunit II
MLGLAIAVCVWFVASRGGWAARLAAVCAATLTITGLVPGVLVGTAMRRGADMLIPSMGASSWLVVMGHLARFAFVGALLALWLARRETREERGLRLIDGADTPRGFAHACLARQWGVVVGAGLATAILSIHEIEATVIIWPPGMRNLAQEMLDALHFQRDERMGAAAVNLLVLGTGVAYLAGWLMLRSVRGRESEPGPERNIGGTIYDRD